MGKEKDDIKEFFKAFSESEEQLDYRMANDKLSYTVDTISTGSISLDDALSCGGLPCGRIIQYYGPPGSSKTLLSMIAIKSAQKKDPEARQVFIDAEQTFSQIWAEQLGLDTSRIILVEGDMAVNGRRCFEMLLGVPKEDMSHKLKGKSKEGLLDQIISKKMNINLVVLDSLGAIIPPGEDVAAVGKMNISLMARFLSTTMKKLSLEVSKANIPFIVINHKRDSMDMYKDHTFMGGNAYSHFLSANLYFELAGGKDSLILDENEEKIGQIVRATVEKSKFGPHPKKTTFKVKFVEGVVNDEEEIADVAVKYNIINKVNNLTHEYEGKRWLGNKQVVAAIAESPELKQELISKIKEVWAKGA
jgi:recombination protein RecA